MRRREATTATTIFALAYESFVERPSDAGVAVAVVVVVVVAVDVDVAVPLAGYRYH